jgi:hypothetical protein
MARPGSPVVTITAPDQGYCDLQGKPTQTGIKLLRRVKSLSGRFLKYELEVGVHSSLPGREEENLKKTELCAAGIRSVLDDLSIPQKFKVRGLGETEADYTESEPYFTYKNQRLEFIFSPIMDGSR